MGEKIVVGPKFNGLINAIKPFAIDNESFPYLLNAYEWRNRIRRKRGTSTLTRLQRYFNSQSLSYNPSGIVISLSNTGSANLITGYGFPPNGSIVPGTVTIVASGGSTTYTDPTKDGYLTPTGTGGVNIINYASGIITIPSQANNTITAIFTYNPSLPVLGLRTLNLTASQFPGVVAFDTDYSYIIPNSFPNTAYDITFYKNPPVATYPGYMPKDNVTSFTWNGQNYQQFWSVNYQNAFWVTNGIDVPFTGATIGMQFAQSSVPDGANYIMSATQTSPTTVEFVILRSPLEVGDFVFANEFSGLAGPTLNFQTGYVTLIVPMTNTYTVTFPEAVIANTGLVPGILQYLTNTATAGKDCLRWFDGDPTLANGAKGWVNFMPPLSSSSYIISDLPPAQYYLVGARMIYPFKDRLLFLGPVVQTSTGSPIYLQDTIVYSQVGTAFYTASFDETDPISGNTVFTPILTPLGEVATADAYWEDITGLGGSIVAGYEQPILTVSPNEDVLIIGFNTRQSRLIYSGDDIIPFNFYIINSELGSSSTFSIINLDRGVLTIGEHGFVITSQIGAERFDMEIPDVLFEFNLLNNGTQRITAQRDFINEWIYFTYCSNENTYTFPTQTLQYNYREKTWALFNECYTSYGQFRHADGLTWSNIGTKYPTWESWTEPWNAGGSTVLQPKVIAGTPQGYVMERDEGTNEGNSIYISNISFPSTITNISNANPAIITTVNSLMPGQTVMVMGVAGMTQINGGSYTITASTPTTITVDFDSTSAGLYTGGGIVMSPRIYAPNHCLNNGDYFVIKGALGNIASEVNGFIFSVVNPTENEFFTNPNIFPGVYLGGGMIQRMYVPIIQTKQFNPAWGLARKTRIGVQQYLFTGTPNGQITLMIYLSQNTIGTTADGYNDGPIVPAPSSLNNGLIYSTVLYTCPESTNLGLTPANTNLQMVTAQAQQQIWHRINTSLLGDTVQLGFTMSDAQMREPTMSNQFEEIELHCFVIDVTPSQLLA